MTSPYFSLLRISSIAADIISLTFAIGLSLYFFGDLNPSTFENYWISHVLIVYSLWFIFSYWFELYSVSMEFVPLMRALTRTFFCHSLATIFFLFIVEQQSVSEFFLICVFAEFLFLLVVSRFIILKGIKSMERVKKIKKRVVIVGNSAISYKAADYFSQPNSGFEFVGFFDDHNVQRKGYPLLGSVESCLNYARENKVDTIYSTLMPETSEVMNELVNEAERNFIRLKFIPDLNLMFHQPVNISVEGEVPVISFRKEPLEKMTSRIRKRAFDILFSAGFLLVIGWWLFPLIALMIKLDSRGPVFFVQKRSGKNNKIFNCLKFRSMRVNEEADKVQATKHDARVTRLGKFLRKSSLDELPQFINVLLGQLSVVGPRPHMLKHTEEYSAIIQKYPVRHFIKPGITGWAQINGYRGDLSAELMMKRVQYDFWYMENWSLWLDVKIVLKTVGKVVNKDQKAY